MAFGLLNKMKILHGWFFLSYLSFFRKAFCWFFRKVYELQKTQYQFLHSRFKSFHKGISDYSKQINSCHKTKPIAQAIYEKVQFSFQVRCLSFPRTHCPFQNFFIFFDANSLDRQQSEQVHDKQMVAQLKRQQFLSLDSQSISKEVKVLKPEIWADWAQLGCFGNFDHFSWFFIWEVVFLLHKKKFLTCLRVFA